MAKKSTKRQKRSATRKCKKGHTLAQADDVPAKKRGRGRPPIEFKESYIELARQLMANGYTRESLAIELNISERTLSLWQDLYPEFARAIRAGAEIADLKMELSLYKRGEGYDYEEVQMEVLLDEKGNPVRRLRRQVTRHVPGDPRCQMFWLRNRQRDRWSEGTEGGTPIGVFVANMTPEQARERERLASLKSQT